MSFVRSRFFFLYPLQIILLGMPPRRLIVHPPRIPLVSQASSGLTTPPTPPGMQFRSAVMAGKDDSKKRGASEVGDVTGALKKQKSGKGTSLKKQQEFHEDFGREFEQIEQPVQDKKQKKKKKKKKEKEKRVRSRRRMKLWVYFPPPKKSPRISPLRRVLG
jgi:hypothetical protein